MAALPRLWGWGRDPVLVARMLMDRTPEHSGMQKARWWAGLVCWFALSGPALLGLDALPVAYCTACLGQGLPPVLGVCVSAFHAAGRAKG